MKIILHTKEDKAWYLWQVEFVKGLPDATIVVDAIGKKYRSKKMTEVKIVKENLLPYLQRELVDGLYIIRQSFTKSGLTEKIEIELIGKKDKSRGQ